MRSRPVDVAFLKEPCNAPPYRHRSFHIINRPQLGRRLKYFMRLVAIGFAYCANRSEVTDLSYSSGPENNYGGRHACRYRSSPRYSASIVPRQFELPQWQANFFFDFSVIGSSISIA
jgi:hypothetical protein